MKLATSFFSLTAFFLLLDPTDAFAITGISAGVNAVTGERPFRRDINELYMSGAAWDLFILALRQFQQVDQDDPLSYYQVAGIHGLPQVSWDGVEGHGQYPGYCPHAAVTFPTWHRPYLALFEQMIWEHAQGIARSYPSSQRDSYVAAALQLRMPFWDAFANATLPLAASVPTLVLNSPNGSQMIDNPLYNYTFHASEGGNRFPSDHWFPWTIRHWDSLNRRSNVSDVNAALQHQHRGVLPLVYAMFTSESDYTNMSCTSSPGSSVEGFHNLVHQAVGGYGHMMEPGTSAFDPIFWLHHTNIDRLFAMWQSINPQSYVVPTMDVIGTYAQPRGFVDADSNLLPFHSDNGSGFWTSSKVRSTRTFGYAYQDTVDWNLTEATLASNVRANVNRLYSPGSLIGTSQQSAPVPLTDTEVIDLESNRLHVASTLKARELERQWTIKVQMRRFAHRTPFSVDFFVGLPPMLPSAWSTASNLIGSHAQFMAENFTSTLPNESRNALSHGEVSLTHYLTMVTQRGELANLEPDSVIPFLTKSLNWRARDMESCELQLDSLAALSIVVGSNVMRPAKALNSFPTFTELEIYDTITAGKPGGTGKEQRRCKSCDLTA